MKFSAGIDTLSKVLSGLFILLAAGFLLAVPLFNLATEGFQWPAYLLLALLFFVTTGITWGLHPTGYTVTEEALVVERPFGAKVWKFEEISSVRMPSPEEMKFAFRTFGSGGLFGYFGRFANKSIGRMTWYATRRSNYVLITTTEGKNIILTPDEPESFTGHLANEMRKK